MQVAGCVGWEGQGSPWQAHAADLLRVPGASPPLSVSFTTVRFPILYCIAFLPLPDKFSLLNLTSFQLFCWANYIKMDVAGTLYGLFIVILFLSHAYK